MQESRSDPRDDLGSPGRPGRPLRVCLVGLTQRDLERSRSAVAGKMEIVGSVLLRRIPRGTASLPSSIDAVVMTPAAWGEASAALTVPQATEPPADEAAGEDPALIEELTPRERDVLVLVAEGRANREIAEQLGISEHTVKFHLAALFGKLAVSTRTQAVRRALEWGLIAI